MLAMPEDALGMSRLININQSLINDYMFFRTQLEERLQRLNEICDATSSLFIRAKSLFEDVNAGLEHMRGAWNGRMFLWNIDAPWHRNLKNAWNERVRGIVQGEFDAGGFRTLNREFWGREDGFFDGYWWQCPDKFRLAFEVLLAEAELLGGIDLIKLETTFHISEANLRMITLQELAWARRTGVWDGSLLSQLEVRFVEKDKFFGDMNNTLDAGSLRWLWERHDGRRWTGFSHWLERGGEEVLLGGMILAGGSARAFASKPVTSGIKGTGGTPLRGKLTGSIIKKRK